MPWEKTEPMKERMKFVLEVESEMFSFSEVCERYGVSRKTGYKWFGRYQEKGIEGLRDQSRAPRHCSHKTPSQVEEEIVELRRQYPRWGPVTLRLHLVREAPEVSWPACSTIGEILKRHDLIQSRRRRRRSQAIYSTRTVESEAPNEIFTADFKGEFRTRNGKYCYPLTILDHYSRYSLCCRALDSTASQPVQEQFEEVFRTYGLPKAILTDNGGPFAGIGLRRLSRLSVWWLRLGIQPLLIRPGHPEENGRHERYHRTLKESAVIPPARDQTKQQVVFDRFQEEYNEQRPHQSLRGRTPSEVYSCGSARSYPKKLPEFEYPGHYEIRKVSSSGEIQFRGGGVFLSHVLEKEHVGLEEIQDGVWSIYLGFTLIARWDATKRKLYG